MPTKESIALFQYWFNYYLKNTNSGCSIPLARYLAYRKMAYLNRRMDVRS